MTAGGGIMHEEMPEPRDGRMEGFQLWVNLPAKRKMMRPRYQEISAKQIPVVVKEDGTQIAVIAGAVGEVEGPVTEIAADPNYLDVTLPPETNFIHPTDPSHTVLTYVFEGKGSFAANSRGNSEVTSPAMVVYEAGSHIEVQAGETAVRFLLISGAPMHEPIARYGPFVMNTRQEIEQALVDLRNGTFVRS
jgi:redox-sensitive bicupin YhaK (pirin superfamily)